MDSFDAGLLLSNLVEAYAVTAEIEAMKAANQEREQKGESQAYPEEAFREKADHLYAISQNIRGLF